MEHQHTLVSTTNTTILSDGSMIESLETSLGKIASINQSCCRESGTDGRAGTTQILQQKLLALLQVVGSSHVTGDISTRLSQGENFIWIVNLVETQLRYPISIRSIDFNDITHQLIEYVLGSFALERGGIWSSAVHFIPSSFA